MAIEKHGKVFRSTDKTDEHKNPFIPKSPAPLVEAARTILIAAIDVCNTPVAKKSKSFCAFDRLRMATAKIEQAFKGEGGG